MRIRGLTLAVAAALGGAAPIHGQELTAELDYFRPDSVRLNLRTGLTCSAYWWSGTYRASGFQTAAASTSWTQPRVSRAVWREAFSACVGGPDTLEVRYRVLARDEEATPPPPEPAPDTLIEARVAALEVAVADHEARIAALEAGGGPPPSFPDTTPPTAPTDLRGSADTTTAHLDWGPAVDAESGVNGYRVQRDGSIVGLTDGVVLSFTDTGLEPGTDYIYAVSAENGEGLIGPAASVTVRTADRPAPPEVHYLVSLSDAGDSTRVRFDGPSDTVYVFDLRNPDDTQRDFGTNPAEPVTRAPAPIVLMVPKRDTPQAARAKAYLVAGPAVADTLITIPARTAEPPPSDTLPDPVAPDSLIVYPAQFNVAIGGSVQLHAVGWWAGVPYTCDGVNWSEVVLGATTAPDWVERLPSDSLAVTAPETSKPDLAKLVEGGRKAGNCVGTTSPEGFQQASAAR